MFRPFVLLLLAAVLLWCCYALFLVTPEGGFARELVNAAIGAVITLAVAGLIALFALRHRIAARREKKVVRHLSEDSWRRRSVRVGEMSIPDMSIVVSCTQGVPWTHRATCTYRSVAHQRPRHEAVARMREQWLKEDTEWAAEQGLVFNDGAAADLLAATLELCMQDGKRVPHYTLTIGETTYFEFASTALKLDRDFVDDSSRKHTLREVFAIEPMNVLDVETLPIPACVGSGTVVVTSDDEVLLGVRRRTFIAGSASSGRGRIPVHVVAEGLLPTDIDEFGNFRPVEGAKRALREELQVSPRSDRIAHAIDLVETGFAFDQQRWQPYFAFLARLDSTGDEVRTGIASATDAWEAEEWIGLPFDIECAGMRLLLQGHHPKYELASNHAAVALWFALLHKHGFEHMRNELMRRPEFVGDS